MIDSSTLPKLRARLTGSLGSLLVFVFLSASCSDGTGPSTETTLPADPTPSGPIDSSDPDVSPGDTITAPDPTLPPPDSTEAGDTLVDPGTSSYPGIPFGTYSMPTAYLNSVHTGSVMAGLVSPTNIVTVLTETRNKGGRLVVKLSKGRQHFVTNPDGTFSLTKWKALVDQYRNIDLAPFIADGTILGHFLIDEPHRTTRWGGQVIPQATVEEMAAYSKQIWPTMPTLVRVVPSWLAAAPVTYTHLDAGWLQYTSDKGDVTALVTAEVAVAKSKGLGLVVGMNVLDGGDGSSRIAGWSQGKYAMSATEIRSYGTVLLDQSYACGFYMWSHDTEYYSRTDIMAAMAELSAKAGVHAKTSCRQ
jgi:hypothetical protein